MTEHSYQYATKHREHIMDQALVYLLQRGPTTAKELARLYEKSESRMREILKKHQTEIQTKKNDVGVNVFWVEPAGEMTPAEAATHADVEEAIDPTGEGREAHDAQVIADQDGCPLCGSTEPQTQAGPDGTFLGAARTCSNCGKTYNVLTKDEITMQPKAEKAKRTPLNPQYKIVEKVDAVKAAGGKLVYERESRQWVLTKAKHDPKRMTAKEFSLETADTLVAAIS
jgi:hypothetical protein